MFNRARIFIIGFLIFFLFCGLPKVSADVKIGASVDKNKLKQDETLVFKIKISGDINSSPKINLPDLNKDFDILSTSQSQSIALQGKESALSINFEYILLPKKEGKLTIGPVEAIYKKELHKTEPIEIEVSPAEKIPVPESPQKEVPRFDDEGTVI